MVDNLNYTNILKYNYNFFSGKYFFGFGDANYSYDPIRIIKLICILISFILNLLIIIFLFIRKKKKFSIALTLTGNILLINFIHTLSYALEWILKEDDKSLHIMKNGTVINNDYNNNTDSDYYQIGGLLIGNPKNFAMCKFQGFSLIFSALTQDVLIIIFFYIINQPNTPSKRKIRIFIIFGYFFPFIIACIYLAIDGIGLNDKYCYIKKFIIDKVEDYNINYKDINNNESYNTTCNVNYKFAEKNFKILVNILYSLRGINLIISTFFLYKIIRYVKLNKLKNIYILKLSAILIVQVIIIFLGLIYRIGSSIDEQFSRKFIKIFLCINTLDGILFPLSYSLSNGVYQTLFCSIRNESKESLTEIQDELKSFGSGSSFLILPSPTVEKTFAMVDVKDDNNFDLSYSN